MRYDTDWLSDALDGRVSLPRGTPDEDVGSALFRLWEGLPVVDRSTMRESCRILVRHLSTVMRVHVDDEYVCDILRLAVQMKLSEVAPGLEYLVQRPEWFGTFPSAQQKAVVATVP